MSHIVTDLLDIYKTYFQQPYCVPLENIQTDDYITMFSQPVRRTLTSGVEVFLPIQLWSPKDSIDLTCATIRATSAKTIVTTAVAGRKGTVKELFQAGDWNFTIKGVLIAGNGVFPDKEIHTLRNIYEYPGSVYLDSALSDLFLDESRQVCVSSLEFPEVEGRNNRHRPFVLQCESDYVTSLRL